MGNMYHELCRTLKRKDTLGERYQRLKAYAIHLHYGWSARDSYSYGYQSVFVPQDLLWLLRTFCHIHILTSNFPDLVSTQTFNLL